MNKSQKNTESDKFTEFAKKLLSAPKPEIKAKAIKVVKRKPKEA
ncbi:MAG: hypothetical protein ACK5LW_05875 [Pseudanabaena sp.]|jgi:hypothetical protein